MWAGCNEALNSPATVRLSVQQCPVLFQCSFLAFVVSNDVASNQKISKFFVSHMEESMTGLVGIIEFIKN
jgi:hypothetical protein